MRLFSFVIAALLLFGANAPAHEGHDHSAQPAPANAGAAPRGTATSDAFELVAIVRDGELALFIDRFTTNEPLEGASVEIETPAGPVKAQTHFADRQLHRKC